MLQKLAKAHPRLHQIVTAWWQRQRCMGNMYKSIASTAAYTETNLALHAVASLAHFPAKIGPREQLALFSAEIVNTIIVRYRHVACKISQCLWATHQTLCPGIYAHQRKTSLSMVPCESRAYIRLCSEPSIIRNLSRKRFWRIVECCSSERFPHYIARIFVLYTEIKSWIPI